MRVLIPTSLSEIKLSQYTRYQKVLKDNQDDETFVCIQMVAIFCNLSVADVMKIPVNDFTDIVESIAKTLDQKPKARSHVQNGWRELRFYPESR
jgi:hypothetical protein